MYLESAYKANHFHVSIITKILFFRVMVTFGPVALYFHLVSQKLFKIKVFLGVFVFALLFDLIGILQQDGR
jgi:hypothetical protein